MENLVNMINRLIDDSYWLGKTVLVTGHTGFKGSWLIMCLRQLGCRVIGLGLKPNTTPSLFEEANIANFCDSHEIDIRDAKKVKVFLEEKKPEVIFHLAAQAIVYESYKNPLETFATNTMGTVNLLDGIRSIGLNTIIVMVTSDKVYAPNLLSRPYREEDPLGGHDPYSASKAASEIIIACYQQAFFSEQGIALASGRAGNVIGGGDWAVDRIIPDCINAWSKGEVLELRNPNSTRPWQHVLEPLSGYLTLAMALKEESALHGEPFNFGPITADSKSVLNLVQEMSIYWNKVNWTISPENEKFHESALLKLNCDKALHLLNWRSFLSFEETVEFTAGWYKNFFENPIDIGKLSKNQIEIYSKIAKKKGIKWAE